MATKKITRKPAAKKTPAKKAPTKKASATKGPGVIASLVEFLTAANAKAPVTKADLVAKLCKRFPDREEKALATTCGCQVGKRIEEGQGIKLHKNDDGAYWATVTK